MATTRKKTTKRKATNGKRPSFTEKYAAELAATGNSTRYTFSKEAVEDIEDANRGRLNGTLHASLAHVSRLLKKEHNIPLSIYTIVKRIKDNIGRESW